MIREHFEEHKNAYWIGSLIVVAGITYVIMKSVKSSLDAGTNGSEMTTLRSLFFSVYARDSGNNIVTTVHTGHKGHPGFRVRHPKTGLIFDTQGSVSRAFDIPETIVSKHLNEKIPDAYGEVFERVKV